MSEEKELINVYGARVHNLKDIDVEIPRNSLTVITGLSGSGKSSLAFDTIFAEGQRRYIETFSAYARNFLGGLERPKSSMKPEASSLSVTPYGGFVSLFSRHWQNSHVLSVCR